MKTKVLGRLVCAVCLVMSLTVVAGCGLGPNEKTKQEIMGCLRKLQPITEFRFLDKTVEYMAPDGSQPKTIAFELKAADGGIYQGFYDGKVTQVRRVR